MNVTNYTSWNIETKLMTLVTYTSRCRKFYLKLSTLPTCSDGWNRGVAHCVKVSGAVLLLPVKWQRLTGAIRTSLQRRHIACGSQRHMKPIPDEMFIHKANLWWNLPDQMFIHNVHWQWNLPDQMFINNAHWWWNLPDQIFIHKANLRWNLPDQMSIHKANLWWNLPEKCLYIKRTYITLHNTPNKISKNICLYIKWICFETYQWNVYT